MKDVKQPKRIAMIGAVGTGKTTLARKLAKHYNLPHIELEKLLFENTIRKNEEEFRSKVKKAVSRSEWVCDGIFYNVADIIWPRADLIIWVDMPLGTTFKQSLRRSLHAIVTKGNKPAGQRETLKTAFGSEGIVRMTPRIHKKVQEKYPALIKQLGLERRLVRLYSTKEVEDWLKQNAVK